MSYGDEIFDEKMINVIVVCVSGKKQLCKLMYIGKKTTNI